MTELRECRICHGDAAYEYVPRVGSPWGGAGLDAMGITVVCQRCGCTIPSGTDQDEVTKRWNWGPDGRHDY